MTIALIREPSPGDLDRARGIDAYRWVSFSPEKRADEDIAEYVEDVKALAASLEPIAGDDAGRRAAAAVEVERYREGYVARRLAVWAASARTASPMITGPARFPTERNRKRMETYEKRVSDLLAWRGNAFKYASRAIARAAKPEAAGAEAKESAVVEISGVRIVTNYELDRVQIFFGGKPAPETIAELKRSGWNWSPRNGAWQRKLTANAFAVARRIAEGVLCQGGAP